MTSLKTNRRGFTIIELLIVVIVIGVMVTLFLTTYSGVQRNRSNQAREDDINTLHNAVETYYGQKDSYPTLSNINDPNWRSENMPSLDAGALQDPKGVAPLLSDTPTAGVYAYNVSPGGCDNADNGDCVEYTLTATLEGGGTIIKNNLY